MDRAEDGDGLAAGFDQIDGDVGVLEVVFEVFFEDVGELFGGKAGGVDAADHGESNIASGVDADRCSGGDFFGVKSADHKLVVNPKRVAAGGAGVRCYGGRWWSLCEARGGK